MTLAIMQPYFFPYIGYWQLINAVDKFVVLDDVNYIKKGWINRNRIILNGKEFLFTLPIKSASQNKLINEIKLDDLKKWRKKFIKTLEAAYKKAPNFESILELVEDTLNYNCSGLSQFLVNSIKKTCNYLGIKTEIVETSTGYNTAVLKKDEKIISICNQESATDYINPIGGQSLYTTERFLTNGINISFIQSELIPYSQLSKDFIPGLSIIDILMQKKITEVKEMLGHCEIVKANNKKVEVFN